MPLFKKKIPVTETEEYKQQKKAQDNDPREEVRLGARKEAEKPPTIQEQIATTTEIEYRTEILIRLANCERILQKVEKELD